MNVPEVFDARGNKISIFDKDGNALEQVDRASQRGSNAAGGSIQRRAYDTSGKRVSAYDKDGNPIVKFRPSIAVPQPRKSKYVSYAPRSSANISASPTRGSQFAQLLLTGQTELPLDILPMV